MFVLTSKARSLAASLAAVRGVIYVYRHAHVGYRPGYVHIDLGGLPLTIASCNRGTSVLAAHCLVIRVRSRVHLAVAACKCSFGV